MLEDVETGGRVINQVWFPRDYARWCAMLAQQFGPNALFLIKALFQPYLTRGIFTAVWVTPGRYWQGTHFQMLYDTLNDETLAARFLGNIACDVVLDHVQLTGEHWLTMHGEKDGHLISSRSYWRA